MSLYSNNTKIKLSETKEAYQNNQLNNSDSYSVLQRRINLDYQHLKMIDFFLSNKVYSYKIIEADKQYYNLNLQERKEVLKASDIDILCKTIVLENTAFDIKYDSKNYKQFYLAVVPYTKNFKGDKIAKAMKHIQNSSSDKDKLTNKHFHFRLAPQEIAFDMTGYKFNCITPFLMANEK